MKSQKGITLIALIITIVILIILAGVAISLSSGENGIFTKAKEAKEKYTIETIREKVEIGIMNLEIDEVALGNEVTIELVLQELLEDGIFESIDKAAEIGNIGEYEVKLKYNEEGKVVIESIEKAEGIRITYTLDPVGYTNGEKVSILLIVQGRVKEVSKPDGLKIYSEKEVLAIDYEVTSNGEYKFIIEDEQGNKQEKNVIVDTIDRLAPNDFEITAEATDTGINITASTEDADADGTSVKSGIEKYEYFAKLETETEYTKYEANQIEGLEYGTYEVYAIAYDKAANSKQSNTVTITREEPEYENLLRVDEGDLQNGVKISVSDYYSSNSANKACDSNNSTLWSTQSGNYSPHYFKVEFEEETIVTSYYLEASNDDINWIKLEDEIHEGIAGHSGKEYNIQLDNNTAYKYYRVYFPQGGWTYRS